MRNAKIMAVLAAVQTGFGVPTVLSAATHAIEATSIAPTPYQGNTVQSSIVKSHLGHAVSVQTGEHNTVAFEVELAGSGTPVLPPAFGPLLRGCAMVEAIDATVDAENVKYTYVASSAINAAEYVTIECYLDNEKHVIENARGVVSFGLNNAGLPVAKFSFIGDYARPVHVATMPTFDYSLFNDAIPVSNANTPTYDFFGFAGVMSALDINPGLQQTYRNAPNFKGPVYTDRKGDGSTAFDSPLISVKDFYAAWESHQAITTGALNLQHGTTAGNIILMNAPKLQLTDLRPGGDDGVMQYNASFNMLPSDAGDDEFSITFK